MLLFFFLGPALIVRALSARFGSWLVSEGLSRVNYAGAILPTGYGASLLVAILPFHLLAWALGETLPNLSLLAAAVAFGVLGFIDDRWGDRSVGGLKGHFQKLLRERVLTTGALKAIAGTGAAALLSAALFPGDVPKIIAGAALIALSANGSNLVDTRPMRSILLFLAGTVALLAALSLRHVEIPLALWIAPGAVVGYLPTERARRGMLGDSGSNLLGGVFGTAVASYSGFTTMTVLVAALAGFHLFTERRSLNAFLREHPALDRLDRWARGEHSEKGS